MTDALSTSLDGEATVDYRGVLSSWRWRFIGSLLRQWCSDQCESCGGSKRLEAHHLDYRSLGREQPTDLVLLCSECHRLTHLGEMNLPEIAADHPEHWTYVIDAVGRERAERDAGNGSEAPPAEEPVEAFFEGEEPPE